MLLNELFVDFFFTFERGAEKIISFLTFICEVIIIHGLLRDNYKNGNVEATKQYSTTLHCSNINTDYPWPVNAGLWPKY